MTASPCPICGAAPSATILAAESHPCLLNALHESAASARAAGRGDLDFVACSRCSFVWNRAFISDRIIYAPGYVNDQSASGVFRDHLDHVIDTLCRIVAGRPGLIVEVGCGQGDVLRTLCARLDRRGLGFDPAYAGPPAGDERVRCVAAPFTPADAADLSESAGPIALIYCRHVLEHLPDPVRMMSLIAGTGARHRAATYLEVPTFEWIEVNGAFYDLFYEHCSLFTRRSMGAALARAGLHAESIDLAFGEQYLATIAVAAPAASAADHAPGRRAASARASGLAAERDRLASIVRAHRSRGPVLLWGAAAKGVSLIAHLGAGPDLIDALIDINPRKQGRFVPIFAQPVLAPAQAARLIDGHAGEATILAMNPNYLAEIRRMAAAHGIDAEIRAITEPDDHAAPAVSSSDRPHCARIR